MKPKLLIALAAVVVLIVAVVIATSIGAPTAQASQISPADYQTQYLQANQQHLLIDVRTPEEFAEGHIEGAVNIPLQTLGDQLNQVPQDIPVVLYCRSGNRSNQALQLLTSEGYTQVYDMGGIIDWESNGYPVIR